MKISRWLNWLTRKPRSIRRRPGLSLERLEDRTLPSTVTWSNPNGGNWNVGANWTGGSVPGTGDDVVINTAAAATITVQSGDNFTVHSVTTAGTDTLSVTGGALTVTAGATILSGPLTMTGGALSATGAGVTATANGATSIAGADLTASGGASLSLPMLTSVESIVNTFTASGANSVLDLSNLTTVTHQGSWTLYVQNGGEMKLTGLASLSTSEDNYYVYDAAGGTLLDPNLTTLNGVNVSTDGTDTQFANAWTTFTNALNGGLTVTAGSYSLPSLTDVDGSSLTVQSGGSLTLAGLKKYDANNSSFEATGANSVLDLSNLATVTNQSIRSWSLFALNGGELKLSGLTSVSTNYDNFYVDDTGGGTLLDPNLTTLNGVNVSTDGTDAQFANAWTTFTNALNGGLTVTAGSYSLPSLTSVDGSSLTVQSGGSLTLAGLKKYDANNSSFEATGANSVLDLSNLTTVTNLSIRSWSLFALNGGELKLSGLTSVSTNYDNFYFTDTGGSTLLDPNLTTLNGVNVTTDGTDTQFANAWTTFTNALNGGLTVTAGTLSLPSLTDLDGTNVLVQAGASLTLPGLKSYSSVVNPGNGSYLAATGAGSVLSLPALTTLAQPGADVPEVYAVNGGVVTLPVLQQGNVTLGNGMSATIHGTLVSLPADKVAGATINVPAVSGVTVTLENSGTLTGTTINVGQGGNVVLGGGTYLGTTTCNVDSAATANLTSTGFNTTYGGTLTGAGAGTVLSPGGAYILDGKFITALGGVTLNFPGSMFQWIGGAIFAALGDVTNRGTINLAGPSDKGFFEDATLDNFGTIIQTGSGNLDLHSNNASPTTLKIEAGASYLIGSNSGIDNAAGGQVSVINAGTIAKTAGTGTSQLFINGPLTNTGTIAAQSGTLALAPVSITQISGTTLTAGTWNALKGATLQFPTATNITTNNATIALDGAGATVTGIANLAANAGSFSLTNGAKFTTAADFANSGTLTVGAGSTLSVTGNLTQTSGGTLNVQIGGTPASGLFGQLAVAKAAALAGAFGLALVNGFAPTVGQQFNVLTFASANGNFASFNGLNPDFTETLTSTALELNVTSAPVDLVTTNVSAPTTATAGQQITVTWKVTNQTTTAAIGAWQDSVYLSATPTITSTSILLGAATHTGGLAANAFYNGTFTIAVPAVAPGTYYVLVQADSLYQTPDLNRANNIATAGTGQLQVSVPALTLGTPLSDSFTAANQDHYYQLAVPAGGSLSIALASSAASGAVALYVGQATLPTPFNYQEAAVVANQPNQTVVVPQVLTAGTYYILAHSVSGAAATAGFTLTATQGSALAVSGISSYSGGNAGNVTVEIDGTNFAPTATPSLTLGGTTIAATSIDFVNAGQLFATFNLSGAAAGNYTLKVQQGAQSATAASSFHVMAVPSPAPLAVALVVPQFVRAGRTGTIVITYSNPTTNDMVAPVLVVSSTNAKVFFSTSDNPSNYVQSAQVLAVAPNGPAGMLRPGQTGQLTLTLLANDTVNNDLLPVEVSQIAAGQPLDLAAQQAALKPDTTSTAAWNVIFGNLLTTAGSTTDSYNAALAQAATYLGSLGETAAQISDVSRLWAFLVSQASAAFPTATLTSALDASLHTPGSLSLAIDRTFLSSIVGRYRQGIFGLGWATTWQTALSVASSGNVTIESGANIAVFAAQANGTYLDINGTYGTLVNAGGVFTLTDTTGTQSVFLPDGQLSYQQDTNGNRITLGYNALNQVVTLTYSPTEVLTLSYTNGLVTTVTDGTGDTWIYAYDAAGHLLSCMAPGNLTTRYTYDTGSNSETANALLTITHPGGSQQDFTYDPATGRLTDSSQSGGALTAQGAIAYAYLGEGEVSATDSANNQTIVWFNDLGLPGRVQDPRGATSSLRYDVNGNLTGDTNAAGNSYQFTYDGNGNLTQSVNPLGQTVHATVGQFSNLTAITDAAGNATRYNYGPTGNLLSITYAGGTQQSFAYDPLGNLTETIEQNGDPVAYQHNAQGLLTLEAFADGTSQGYTYDAHGNLLTAKTLAAGGTLTGTTMLSYNAANELLSITYPSGQFLGFSYDPTSGQRTQSVDQNGFTVNYSYDALGRLAKLTDGSGNLIVQYTYNSLGQLANKQNGNGTYTTYAYDPTGNLIDEVNYASGTTVNSSFNYTYNLLGEQTSVTDNTGALTEYGYDAAGQLTQVTLPGGTIITYIYTAAGDRTEVVNHGATTSYSSNADNEITQVGSAIYTYDANGNLHTVTDAGGTTTYTFNDLNQLVSIAAPDGSVSNFQYSPLGFLVGTSTTTGTSTNQTNYLVDPTGLGNAVASYNGSGSLIAHYDYGLGLVSQSGPTGIAYYDFNGTGNTVGVTGPSGTYVNQYSYLPFGETTTIAATLPNPFTFVGQYGVMQIGASLFSMRARAYTPVTGQFLSNDPIGLAGGDANIRRYVHNNPVTGIDPQGRDAVSSFGELYPLGSTPYIPIGGGYVFRVPILPPGVPKIMIPLGDGDGILLVPLDPNALIGPAGFGTQDFISLTGNLPYTVDFENDGSAAAQDVTVTEQLDPNLDWSTFQLGSFGFGAVKVTVPAGLTQYQTTVTYQNTDGSALNVLVNLNFNVQTGLLTVTFTSLDPLAGVAPVGVFDGFLPPDNSSGVGEGFVQYTVRPKATLTTGATINQQATVVFDTNAPIATKTVSNTIDAVAPTSSIAALPATETSPFFKVSWAGSDDAGGSGIASYDIFVSDNGGPFTAFLAATTQTSATFGGQNGHTYGFYSVATDNVGNRQATPTTVQATTTVTLPPGFSYSSTTKVLTLTGTAATNSFNFAQATTEDAGGTVHTIYTFTLNGNAVPFPDTALADVVVSAQGTGNTAILITNDTYVDNHNATQETQETISLGSKADAGVGTLQKYDAHGTPFTFLTLSNFPVSYAYVGRGDGTVQLYGTAGVAYNGFVSAGNYSYIGGPGLFHLVQGAASVYGYSAGQATDFAYHYSANAGSAFVVSGTAFSYMSAMDTVNGVTQSYFNVGVGFLVNTGVSNNPGKDYAYIIDSPGNDTFVGGTGYSYMYMQNADRSFAELDTAYAFALVFGQSFVGGTDTAINNDPNKNILVGFRLQ